jgi:hypothetical protein
MRLRIFMRYSHGTSGRFENAVPDTLVALLKMMDIEEEFPALPRVLRTLSRKLRSTTGNWGEEPRFPVVNFRGKMDGYMSNGRVELSLIHHLFHGNRSQMYSDKSVYAVMDENMKQPLLATKPITSTGAAQWITPA